MRLSQRKAFGGLVGGSTAMRAAYAQLERAASVDATVLLEGETGTGKGAAAEALHRQSARASSPFVTVDCGAIPGPLLESELFGHDKGAYTGAVATSPGAFEAAAGGTVFLDEIGELPLDLQPKLLRVLEHRQVRRLGSPTARRVDVRIVAASNRDLQAEIDAGRFRRDLYFRLAVVPITLPPLREHLEDVPELVERFLDGADEDTRAAVMEPAFLARLARASWPGNVRELRNHLERCLVFRRVLDPEEDSSDAPRSREAAPIDPSLPYEEARRRALHAFEQGYLDALLEAHAGDVSAVAQAARIHLAYAYKLVKRHGLGR